VWEYYFNSALPWDYSVYKTLYRCGNVRGTFKWQEVQRVNSNRGKNRSSVPAATWPALHLQ